MIRYLKIYKALLKINLSAFVAYRGNFVNSMASSLIWGIFSFATIVIITSKNGTFFGWTRVELIVFTAGFNIFLGVFHAIFSNNFQRLSRMISLGQLDSLLLKPLDSQFSSSFWMFNYSSFARIVLGLGIILFVIFKYDISIQLENVLFFIPLFLLGLIILYSVWLSVLTILIWIPELHNLIDLLYTLNGYTRYPSEMYKTFSTVVLLVVFPLVLAISVPFRLLLGRVNYMETILLIICSVLFSFLSRFVWRLGLRSYTSASN